MPRCSCPEQCPECGFKIKLDEGITARELEVIKLVAKGLSSTEIGKILFISPKTVKNHKSSVYEKMNFRSSLDAIKYLLTNKIVTLEELGSLDAERKDSHE